MGLQAILDTIHASGEARVCEIEARVQAQAQETREQARAEAQRLREEALAAASALAARERARIIQQARLETLRIVGNVREALVDMALHRTHERLAGMRTDAAYSAMLRRLIDGALAELRGSLREEEQARLEADPRDRALLESILFDTGLDLPVSYEIDCWGGLIAKSEDSRVVVLNTLEARLERAMPYLRRYLGALFGGDQPEVAPSRAEIATEV
jgi:vacuolar-type H+-ATPase subunit E/Vma4